MSTLVDDQFEDERPRLTGLAYRMTGSRMEAEDIVQEAWIRWQAADRREIRSPAAWLTTVTSRLALDRLRSAQRTREEYVGPWLPEVISAEPSPAEHAELAESLTIGFLAMLERLDPVERVVFVLADVFATPFAEIAEVVGRSADACRQVASRARRRVRDGRPRFHPTDEDAWHVTLAFMEASQAGDLDTLVTLLAEDAQLVGDGGPLHHAARRPITAERIPRFVTSLVRRGSKPGDVSRGQVINGQPGIVVFRDGAVFAAFAFAVADGLVQRVFIVNNPDKLAALDLAPIP
jgi:RNA polymerase sigma-70 factor (ECF subfamily)